jgi:hypothetical protein
MSASRKSTIDKAKYKAEYKRRYGEDLPDEVYNTLGSKMNRKLAGIKEKIRKKLMKKAEGGSLKPVPQDNKGLKKLPTKVRNKMGYMKSGGKVMRYRKGGMVCPINGMAKRGRTKGTTVVA